MRWALGRKSLLVNEILQIQVMFLIVDDTTLQQLGASGRGAPCLAVVDRCRPSPEG
jgi:hypothetical protein